MRVILAGWGEVLWGNEGGLGYDMDGRDVTFGAR
jgi:hypothetical protein